MKTVFLSIVVLLFSSGCLEMATPEVITSTREQLSNLTKTIDEYQAKVVEITGQVNKKIDELQPIVEEAVEAVLSAEYSGDKLTDMLIAIQAGNKVTSVVNPYSGVIDSGLTVLMGLLGVGTLGGAAIAVKNKRIVKNVNKMAAEASPDEGKKLIAVIG